LECAINENIVAMGDICFQGRKKGFQKKNEKFFLEIF
jgi:hypothetical protein